MILSAERDPQESTRRRKERGVKRVDDRKVLSGIIPVIQKGCAGWMPRRPTYGPHKTPLQPLPPLVRQGCF